MHSHIRRWHTRYRVIGESGDGAARLGTAVRERVGEPYATAIERAFANDPAVYVLRRIHTELTVVSPSMASEAEMARRWAAQICAAVVHKVTRESDRTDQMMRFEDAADYIARFVADLLDGVAWERWYYGAFSTYRRLAAEEAVRRVLTDFRDHLPAIFQRLAEMGRLRATLARMDPWSAAELWRRAVDREQEPASPEHFLVFLRAALSLIDALNWWSGAPAVEEALLLRYFHTRPAPPDWKQPRALAAAVFSIICFLHSGGWLRLESDSSARFVRQREELLGSMEWLDREWLTEAIQAYLSQSPVTAATPAMSAATPAVIQVTAAAAGRAMLSPLQRKVMELLLRVLATGGVTLSTAEPDAPSNALALFAMLCAAEPGLASRSMIPSFLRWLLEHWRRSHGSLADVIEALLQRHSISDGRLRIPSSADANPGATTTEPAQTAPAVGQQDWIESRCAGIFLLSRAVLEGRVAQLASALGLPQSAVLLALAAEWAGCDPDTLDPGVLFWAGYDREVGVPSAHVQSIHPAAAEELCLAIERILRDRSAFAPSLAPVREPDAPIFAAIATHLLRLWAHWLPGVGKSNPNWLLNRLIRRPGLVHWSNSTIKVALRPAPLDVVLHMAGYFKPVPAVPWLGDRCLTFTVDSVLT